MRVSMTAIPGTPSLLLWHSNTVVAYVFIFPTVCDILKVNNWGQVERWERGYTLGYKSYYCFQKSNTRSIYKLLKKLFIRQQWSFIRKFKTYKRLWPILRDWLTKTNLIPFVWRLCHLPFRSYTFCPTLRPRRGRGVRGRRGRDEITPLVLKHYKLPLLLIFLFNYKYNYILKQWAFNRKLITQTGIRPYCF